MKTSANKRITKISVVFLRQAHKKKTNKEIKVYHRNKTKKKFVLKKYEASDSNASGIKKRHFRSFNTFIKQRMIIRFKKMTVMSFWLVIDQRNKDGKKAVRIAESLEIITLPEIFFVM